LPKVVFYYCQKQLLKIDNIVGTLEKGKLADLIIIDGNPLEDIKTLVNVERTYRSGKLVYEK
jgi:imidazolonepropionase-like amidohydrolase